MAESFESHKPHKEVENYSQHHSDIIDANSKFKNFLKYFKLLKPNCFYCDVLMENYHLKKYYLTIELTDLILFDNNLANNLIKKPDQFMKIFERVVNEIAIEMDNSLLERNFIQLVIEWNILPIKIKEITSNQISKLVKINGMVISVSETLSRPDVGLNKENVSVYSYQMVNLQESPENMSDFEIPMKMDLLVDRNLCDIAIPGNRVAIVGIYSIISTNTLNVFTNGTRNCYIKVVSIVIEKTGSTTNRFGSLAITVNEENEFREFSTKPDLYDIIFRSIAPGLYGYDDVKKALACMLFGGCRNRVADELYCRGNIHILIVGDPGTGKTEFLKFIKQCAPIADLRSGLNISMSSLTASITRNNESRVLILEGGAMVLGDGGVVCIDDFDKINEDVRVAIFDSMTHQFISISTNGMRPRKIDSRCSVLAVANSLYGRSNNTICQQNIDFISSVMSKFDLIFYLQDSHNKEKDRQIAKHIISLFQQDFQDFDENISLTSLNGESCIIPLHKLKKYIAFCRDRCEPILTDSAINLIVDHYVAMRSNALRYKEETGQYSSTPVDIRTLETLIRISESLAKMRLSSYVDQSDVLEAIRLLKIGK